MTAPHPPTLQTLSPVSARLCLDVERFFLHELRLPRGLRLLLALSGGADSTALALVLRLLASRLDLSLHALTVNHGLRPEAEGDAAHVLDICSALAIPCSVRKADVREMAAERGIGLEEAGRKLRYALLEEERGKVKADFIALGHHAGDVSEDVLLRLTRGTGWPALGGMDARDDGRRLVRPLLASDPGALKTLLHECGLSWREDASNTDRRFKRNRLRHDALPLLRKENPALDRTVHDLWRMARLDREFWDELLDAALAQTPWQETGQPPAIALPAPLLAGLRPAARLRLYMRAVRRLHRPAEGETASTGQARSRTLLALDEALQEGRGNTRFQLPGGLEAYLKGGGITFSAGNAEKAS